MMKLIKMAQKNRSYSMTVKIGQSALLVGAMSISSTVSAQHKLDLAYGYGLDNNPFRLNEALQPQQSTYQYAKLAYKYTYKKRLYFGGQFNQYDYQKDEDSADNSRHNLYVGYKNKLKNKDYLNLRFDVGTIDKTYVSRTTGEVAESNDTPLNNRLDNDWMRLYGSYRFYINKSHWLSISTELLDKDYYDYSIAGLSNLDYLQKGIEANWRFRPIKSVVLNSKLRYKVRDYDNKLGKDSEGNSLEGTRLSYSYLRTTLSAKWSPKKEHSYSFTWSSEDKSDNYSGYYDSQYSTLSLGWEWKQENQKQLSVNIRHADYSSKNNLNESEWEEEINTYDNKGLSYSVRFEQPIIESKLVDVNGYIKANYYNYLSPNIAYEYNRYRLEIGIKASF